MADDIGSSSSVSPFLRMFQMTPKSSTKQKKGLLIRTIKGTRRICRRNTRGCTIATSIIIILLSLSSLWWRSMVSPSTSFSVQQTESLESIVPTATINTEPEESFLTWKPPKPIVHQVPGGTLKKLQWEYGARDKYQPYTGSKRWLKKYPERSNKYYNCLATFSGEDDDNLHGLIGRYPNGTDVWQTKPKPPDIKDHPSGPDGALKHGGFYLELSDALPVSRIVPDSRESICKDVVYDYNTMGDTSIIITFFNEPMSTLLRTVYSVLNYTPPPLLKEIILVDDHSDHVDCLPGGRLYQYVNFLPKVKLMRLSERRGIVHARLAGARSATGDVLVVLDSHIEVNRGWIEPQLHRIAQDPQVVVFPQILGLSHETLQHNVHSGIGCYLSWRWSIVEQASLTGKIHSTQSKPSPSMAGGLFAIDREYFWDIGGYDEGFVAWGAENVEMAFRVWMCGGRVECTPCSRTYHIYRKGGSGYSNPAGALWRNRQRTALIWMDEYYQLAKPMIDHSASRDKDQLYNESIGDVSKMLKLKKDLQCKSFKWFLENVDPKHDALNLDDVIVLGQLRRNVSCLDLHGQRSVGSKVLSFHCHRVGSTGANQGFYIARGDNRIRLMANDKRCLSLATGELQLVGCSDEKKAAKWTIVEVNNSTNSVPGLQRFRITWNKNDCMTIHANSNKVTSSTCKGLSDELFEGEIFDYDANYKPPVYVKPSLRRKYTQ